MTDTQLPWTLQDDYYGVKPSQVDKKGPWNTRTDVDVSAIDDPLDLCAICQGLYVTAKAKQEVGNEYGPILLCQPCSKPYFKRLSQERAAREAKQRKADVRTLEQRFLQEVKKGWHPTRDARHHPIGLLLPNGKVVYVDAPIFTVGEKHRIGTFGLVDYREVQGKAEYVEVHVPATRVLMTVEEFHMLSGWTSAPT